MEEEKIVCPNCGNEDNFHFNYDYSQIDLPIEGVLCNECGQYQRTSAICHHHNLIMNNVGKEQARVKFGYNNENYYITKLK